jgi:hypothetical membrane protein
MTTRLLLLVGAIGPVYYIALTLVLGLAWDGYDPIQQTQSELGAVDAPNSALMNVAGFIALGAIILLFSIAYAVELRNSAWKLLAVGLLALAGFGMVAVGFFPCDTGCVDVTATGRLHSTLSMPGAIGVPLAVMVSSPALRADGRFGLGWQTASFWIGLVCLATGPVVALELLPEVDGLLQRFGMWLPLLWVSALSISLTRRVLIEGPQSDGRSMQ